MNYDYGYEVYPTTQTSTGVIASIGIAYFLIMMAISVFLIISLWRIYKKAGKQGWECLIPIYNIIVLLDIVKLPTWYIILFIIPFANIYAMFKIYIELAHKFGKSSGFGVLTVFFPVICIPILAFGNNSYQEFSEEVPSQSSQNYQQPMVNNQIPNNNINQNQAVNTISNVNTTGNMGQTPVNVMPQTPVNQMPNQANVMPQAPVNQMPDQVNVMPQAPVNQMPDQVNVVPQAPVNQIPDQANIVQQVPVQNDIASSINNTNVDNNIL